MSDADTVMTTAELRVLHAAGAISVYRLVAQGASWVLSVVFATGGTALLVRTRDKAPRMFPDPGKLLRQLRELGVVNAQCDMRHWTPEQRELQGRRPDRSLALKRLHARAAEAEREAG